MRPAKVKQTLLHPGGMSIQNLGQTALIKALRHHHLHPARWMDLESYVLGTWMTP
jgi:hypothetical protein